MDQRKDSRSELESKLEKVTGDLEKCSRTERALLARQSELKVEQQVSDTKLLTSLFLYDVFTVTVKLSSSMLVFFTRWSLAWSITNNSASVLTKINVRSSHSKREPP